MIFINIFSIVNVTDIIIIVIIIIMDNIIVFLIIILNTLSNLI